LADVSDKLKTILKLSRLKFLLGGIVANTFGGTLALYDAGKLNLPLLLAGQLIISLTQLMGQYQNEYWDIETDKLATQRSFSGGTDVLAKGALSKISVMILSLSLLFTAFSAVIFLSLALSARTHLITIFFLAAFLS
jgi:4-hydroxybenzoate polyprenyltransferase